MQNKIEDKPNRYFHVTPLKNLESILENGLIPQIGERSLEIGEPIEAVFLFPNFEEMNDALYNWLGEEFDDDEDLAILQIDLPDNFPVYREFDDNGDEFYEAHCQCDIPVEYITGIYNEFYNSIRQNNCNYNNLNEIDELEK